MNLTHEEFQHEDTLLQRMRRDDDIRPRSLEEVLARMKVSAGNSSGWAKPGKKKQHSTSKLRIHLEPGKLRMNMKRFTSTQAAPAHTKQIHSSF
jgi:hypothetical protein